MQLLFDVERSKKVNPPNYGEGIIHIERKAGKLANIRTVDSKGNSLQPRDKNLENTQRATEHSFRVNNVMYNKEVMVTELCDDGIEELISGYGRKHTFENMGVETYFWDVVKFESPYWKTVWKRRFNASKDHIAQGTPNTIGTYQKGLVELKEEKAVDISDDDAIRQALYDMSDGQLSEDQIESNLKKFRKSNSKYSNIVALDKKDANAAAKKLGIATSGYVKDISSSAWDTVGFVYRTGNLEDEVISWAKKYEQYKKQIEITGYIEHTNLDEEVIKKARKVFEESLKNTIENVVKKYLGKEFHNMVHFKGFLAQITTPDPDQGGKPKERGLVDVDGNIIYEMDANGRMILGPGLESYKTEMLGSK
jgi:hypothetical protein|tara:strand:+ start:134 stop:1231 length:1098 start_codon:yes stop_codon:yes gene_type:complete